MKTTFLLLALAAVAVTLLQAAPSRGAPKKPLNTFDQRQEGDVNVQAKLENFLFVVVPFSTTGSADLSSWLENGLLSDALNLRNIASRVSSHPEKPEIVATLEDSTDSAAETSVVKIESQESTEKEPGTSVKLIAIVERDLPEVVASSQSSQADLKNEKDLKSDIKTKVGGEAIGASEISKKTARSLAKASGELSLSKLPPRAIDQQPALENKVSGIGLNERGNSVGPAEREPQELKLLGGAIENCGPDRFRDRFGVCQFRVNA